MANDTPATGSDRPKPKRKLWKILAVLTVLAVALVLALPSLLSTAPARAWVVGQVNSRLKPGGSITLDGLSISWTSPIELTGLSLLDPKNKTVGRIKSARIDRGILALLSKRPDYGTIILEGMNVDVVRGSDGSIDVLDALKGLMPTSTEPTAGGAPVAGAGQQVDPTRVIVVVKDGQIRVDSPELVDPIMASLDGSITLVPGQPIKCKATLEGDGRSLTLNGRLSRDPQTDSTLTLTSRNWPFHVTKSGVAARGRLEGTFTANRQQGLWSATGDPTIVGLEADGPALSGDKLALDKVVLNCDLGQSTRGWNVRRFDMTSPLASIEGQGAWPTTDVTPTTLRGTVDLARLAKMLPNAMKLRDALSLERGVINIRADLTAHEGLERVALVLRIDDLRAVENGRAITLQVPPRLTATATRSKDKVTIEGVEIVAAGVDVKASGDLDAGVKLSGTVDLSALHAQMVALLDLGALDFNGQARLLADYKRAGETYQARFAADARDLTIVGLTSTPIHRDVARLDLTAVGARKPDGSPADWHTARLDLKAGDLAIDILGRSTPDAIALTGTIDTALTTPAAGKGRAEAKLTLHPTEKTCEVQELRLWLAPDGPNATAGTFGLIVQGQVDLAQGLVSLKPIAGAPIGGLGLAPEGLKVTGLASSSEGITVKGAVVGDPFILDNLISAWTGAPPKGLTQGTWSAGFASTKLSSGAMDLDATINLSDLAATGPVSLAIKGGYTPKGDRLDIQKFALDTHYGRVVAQGRLEDATTARHAAISGTIEPDWAVIRPILTSKTTPTAKIQATVRPFQINGSLKADTTPQLLSQIGGEFGIDLAMLDVYGVTVGATPITLKLGGGQANFDPIKTTINDGPTLLLPSLAFDNDYGLWLRLAAGSRIDNMVINDEVSDTLLSFVAPVLKQSSQVRGQVSVGLAGASVPITSTGATHLEGHVAFLDVAFNPGPLGTQFTTMTGRPVPRLALKQDVQILVADGRVTQSGLSIPIGGDGMRINLEGSVGFDKTLNARATVPLTASMLGKDPRFQKLLDGMKVTLPIGGTLSRPVVDPRALQVALKDAGKAMVEQRLNDEAAGIIDKVGGSDADAIKGLLNGLGGRPKKK